MESDPHIERLIKEYANLINLSKRSEGRIRVEPIDLVPGMPPDKYVITFDCKGIERISENKEPVASLLHRVSMYITREYPQKQPYLLWLTPIWHPNIAHEEPRHVCINPQNYYASQALDDFVLMLGEMVQYKRYHALPVDPLPYDPEVAEWVLSYAEPRGIVGPDKPFDPEPFERTYDIRVGERKTASSVHTTLPPLNREGILLGNKRSLLNPDRARVRKPGLKLGVNHKL